MLRVALLGLVTVWVTSLVRLVRAQPTLVPVPFRVRPSRRRVP
jgi:hypothetical protein